MSRPAYVITTCGAGKSETAQRADEFYTGSFVRLQGKTAYLLKPKRGRVILSNKYGFLLPGDMIPGPYDSHWGYADTMSDDSLRAMIGRLKLAPGDYVVNLGSKEYARQTRRLFPEDVRVIWPAKHLPRKSMAYYEQLHAHLRTLGRVPDLCLKHCEYTLDEV